MKWTFLTLAASLFCCATLSAQDPLEVQVRAHSYRKVDRCTLQATVTTPSGEELASFPFRFSDCGCIEIDNAQSGTYKITLELNCPENETLPEVKAAARIICGNDRQFLRFDHPSVWSKGTTVSVDFNWEAPEPISILPLDLEQIDSEAQN